MIRSFQDVERNISKGESRKRIVLAGAHDEPALKALIRAKRKGAATGILIGDEAKILELLDSSREPADAYTIIHEPEEQRAAALAVSMVRKHEADIPMKGLMQTSAFLRAILDRETGLLPQGSLLSQSTVFVYPDQDRIMFASDCAVNITPGLEEKVKIIRNAVHLARCFGIAKPKVAAISALEKVNEKIPGSADAAALSKMEWEDCEVGGPYALDIAADAGAARHKGVGDAVAGQADILLMPDLCTGNVFHKTLHYFAHYDTASVLCGAQVPVILTSRTDSPDTKYHSVLTAVMQCG